VFKDLAKSGTRIAGRDQFLEMVSYLNNHIQEKGIVLWELSRFSRDYNDAQFYLADIRRQGYAIFSMTDNIPPGLDGQMLESLKLWMNAKFIEDLRKNTKRGMDYIINNYHAYIGKNIPLGYARKQIKIGVRRSRDNAGEAVPHMISILEINPETAPLVKRAFEMRATGATYDEIDKELKLFNCLMSYHDLLKNTKYTGKWRGINDYCPPIIDEPLFNQAQDVNKTAQGMG
jgi:DNA invertase Pin-like site-specific DNA recombinase